MVRQHTRPVTRDLLLEECASQVVQPRFSVILCTYNRRSFVLATLTSLRRQTFPRQDFEVIVVDNGSTDGTLNAVRSYIATMAGPRYTDEAWRVQCFAEPRHGLAYARNAGLMAASGEIVVFLDDDTLVEPGMLERLWQAYEETGADAVGMRVAIQWDILRPHWLVDELLEMLGYFAPELERSKLGDDEHFSNCAFSVTMDALRSINYCTAFLSKRLIMPASNEVVELCQRLHRAGCVLWYEPKALVLHRATSTRLRRAFFIDRSYWQGRSEVMQQTAFVSGESKITDWREIGRECISFARCFFLQSPLVLLVSRSSAERLLASMEQAYSWGRVIQRLAQLEHVSPEMEASALFLVHEEEPGMTDDVFAFLKHSLGAEEVRYITGKVDIPLIWLWKHRKYRDQPVGILHFYRPGTLELDYRQRQRLRFRLWLARRWGIRIVSTDTGGWWQCARGPRFRARRVFERMIFHASHAVVCSIRQPSLLYRERRLRRRVQCLPLPGYRGYYAPALPCNDARRSLGLSPKAGFAYLCLAHLHTDREVIFLLEAFQLLKEGARSQDSRPDVQLLVVGHPADQEASSALLKLATSASGVIFRTEAFRSTEIPLYMGACNALVMPHFAVRTAGSIETASLALSYELLIVAPDLPRFSGMLPPQVSLPYIAASRESLAEAMVKAQQTINTLQEKDIAVMDARESWEAYTRHLLNIYRKLLGANVESDEH